MTDPAPAAKPVDDVMKKLVALCKNRGFIFQSSEIYGGLKSAYDYGPLGAELKRNIMSEWWRDMVTCRENVVGIDASIIMRPEVWRASGHAAGFADPLVDCKVSKERFRADKAPRPAIPGPLPITCPDKGVAKTYAEIIEQNFGVVLERDGNVLNGLKAIIASEFGFFPKGADAPTKTWPWRGYVSPLIGSPFLTEEKQFNLMFRTALGAVDPMQEASQLLARLMGKPIDKAIEILKRDFASEAKDGNGLVGKAIKTLEEVSESLKRAEEDVQNTSNSEIKQQKEVCLAASQQACLRMQADAMRALIEHLTAPSMVYLRPETAQAMFVQFKNVQQSMSLKPPFGIAQMGKSFRNEVTVEHFIFRSCEFEQMEMEFFCEPGTQGQWMDYWKEQRMNWWKRYAHHPEKFKFRPHEKSELAHYADQCFDVEYEYPWGWGELEGIASRTDHDLHAHQEASGENLEYIDQEKADPKTGKKPWRYLPYVIEPAAGATRAVLCFLLDAYHEEERKTATGETERRTVLKLHPRLAPIKCAVLPLVKKDGMPEKARDIIEKMLKAGINAKYDEKNSIGKRYAKHDEIGTPWCVTVDGQSLTDGTVTVRDRDTTEQIRITVDEVVATIKAKLEA
jgi:glycyl-tRNA synthetase